MEVDVTVVGGGLAGILAAIRCSELGYSVALVDDGLPESNGDLGGFAKFSGAKFSLPPAGLGLLPVAGDDGRLQEIISYVLEKLELNLDSGDFSTDLAGIAEYSSNPSEVILRQYHSIVLTPNEIDYLVAKLTTKLVSSTEIVRGKCTSISGSHEAWLASIDTTDGVSILINSKVVFFGGGRMSGSLLESVGVKPQVGKGLDVGVRVEFLDPEPLLRLRGCGPDAKFLYKNCRTFCLNLPGEVFYYPFGNLRIPGGIVTGSESTSANIGILYRAKHKESLLSHIHKQMDKILEVQSGSVQAVVGSFLGEQSQILEVLYGHQIVTELEEFGAALEERQLVDWSYPHRIHIPLLDWHWDVYGEGSSHRTNIQGVYVVGDSSGHARGLLQAAVSGVLCAEEYHGH